MDTSHDDRYLRAFHEVCRAGTVSAAAVALHRSQPTLSYQLHQLERSLGTKLFERQGRRLILTPAGESLREFCDRFFAEYERLRGEFPHASQRARPLHIASVSAFGRYVLVKHVLPGLDAAITPHVRFPVATEVFARVRSGAAAVGFAHYRSSSRELRCMPVFTERLVLIHPRRWRMPGLDAIESLPFVAYDESDALVMQWFLRALGRPPPKLHTVAHFEEIEEAVAWVALERGVAAVPDFCVAGHEKHVGVLATPRACTNTLHAVLSATAQPTKEVRELLTAVRRLPDGMRARAR